MVKRAFYLYVVISFVALSPSFAYFIRKGGTGAIYEGQQATYSYGLSNAPTGNIFGDTYPGYFKSGYVMIGADLYHRDFGVEPPESGRMYISSGVTSFQKSFTFTFYDNGTFWPYSGGYAEWWFDDDINNRSHYGGILNLSASASQRITVLNVYPTIESITADLVVEVGEEFNFSAYATDPGKYDYLTYNWDFDHDGYYDDFSGKSGQWSYSSAGSYAVRLKVSDGDGGRDSRSFSVTVIPEPVTFLLLSIGSFCLIGKQKK